MAHILLSSLEKHWRRSGVYLLLCSGMGQLRLTEGSGPMLPGLAHCDAAYGAHDAPWINSLCHILHFMPAHSPQRSHAGVVEAVGYGDCPHLAARAAEHSAQADGAVKVGFRWRAAGERPVAHKRHEREAQRRGSVGPCRRCGLTEAFRAAHHTRTTHRETAVGAHFGSTRMQI